MAWPVGRWYGWGWPSNFKSLPIAADRGAYDLITNG